MSDQEGYSLGEERRGRKFQPKLRKKTEKENKTSKKPEKTGKPSWQADELSYLCSSWCNNPCSLLYGSHCKDY